jgi:CBS domain-containing protein
MAEKRIKRLPVVDEQGRLTGVISRADIIKFIGEIGDIRSIGFNPLR